MPLPTTLSPLARLGARDGVYQRLRDWILSGPLEPGEVLKDAEIGAIFGVSRTPVREALLRLESEGLVATSPARWTRVTPIRLDQGPNLYRAVAALDALAAEQAAPVITEAQLIEMESANDLLLHETTADGFHRCDLAFHDIYRQAAANEIVLETLDRVLFEVHRLDRAYFQDFVVSRDSYVQHQLIIEALRRRDAGMATEAARSNWLQSIPRLVRLAEEAKSNGSDLETRPSSRSSQPSRQSALMPHEELQPVAKAQEL